ncbi:MAG: preprotein translocase subunit SecG [Gammaproteobacteria bacterium RIFCSPHIGHO2_12_FULL_35_23]|nr:MAG: preprotein translocase subunit SecG [Gammaproteobacteria bacterium RIFCSPHIGHO2_12_FULL_35_23]
MQQIILIIHVAFALALIILILLQQGKGATVGASFGAGASQTIFGSQGAGSFMMKITAFFALVFFITSLVLGHFANAQLVADQKASILSNVEKISQMQTQEQGAAQNAAMQINEMPQSGLSQTSNNGQSN